MHFTESNYLKTKREYLRFLKSQEILSEPFRNKVGQLNNFLPISKEILKFSSKIKKLKLLV